MSNLNNKFGFTLVELLATIVISSIILVFVGSLITKSFNTYDRTASENAIRDEADIIMAKLNKDVFPLTAADITRLNTTCTSNASADNCTSGAWLLLNNDTAKRIGYENNQVLSLSGNYSIQNENIKIVSFKVCYIPTNGSISSAECTQTTTTAYPSYVFKLKLENTKKNIEMEFTNEISIVY